MKAKVILRGAITYSLGGKRWIKDVPGIVHGEDQVKLYKENGYFYVVPLKDGGSKKKKDKDTEKKSKAGKPQVDKKKAKLKK